ncbi:prepilin-type N-terminal cleavage/methylation domain-containing protein [bacterium]|nr:prepilin-type N-terminal cleavage/methylation domain-containing protein [bacterium]
MSGKTRGLTLVEVLVTLTLIGVLALVVLPVVNNVRPDQDRIFFKKGIYTFQNALSGYIKSSEKNVLENLTNSSAFCSGISEIVHTVGVINCADSSYDNPNFITNDGLRFWGLEGTFSGSTVDVHGRHAKIIYMDRKLTSSEKTRLAAGKLRGSSYTSPGLKIYVNTKGKVSISASDTYEAELTQDLNITK